MSPCVCLYMCHFTNSPLLPVHIQFVQVSSQAVFSGTKGFVSSVCVYGSGTRIKHTAVTITTLDQGTVCRNHAPCVQSCTETQRSVPLRKNNQTQNQTAKPILFKQIVFLGSSKGTFEGLIQFVCLCVSLYSSVHPACSFNQPIQTYDDPPVFSTSLPIVQQFIHSKYLKTNNYSVFLFLSGVTVCVRLFLPRLYSWTWLMYPYRGQCPNRTNMTGLPPSWRGGMM